MNSATCLRYDNIGGENDHVTGDVNNSYECLTEKRIIVSSGETHIGGQLVWR